MTQRRLAKMRERKAGEEKGCGISVPRMVLILQIHCVIPSCNHFASTTLMQSLFPRCLGYISVQTWNPQWFPQPTTVYAESGPPSDRKEVPNVTSPVTNKHQLEYLGTLHMSHYYSNEIHWSGKVGTTSQRSHCKSVT